MLSILIMEGKREKPICLCVSCKPHPKHVCVKAALIDTHSNEAEVLEIKNQTPIVKRNE